MKIAFLGYGHVGARLASHLQSAGHQVTLIAHQSKRRESASLKNALKMNSRLAVGDEKVLSDIEVVILAVPFEAVEKAVKPLEDALKGKILVDCTNPVGPKLTHGLQNQQSGTEWIQRTLLPDSFVVKAFTIYGYENFEEMVRLNQKTKEPVMLYCGDHQASKKTVSSLIQQLGWVPVDVGGADNALHLEHMTLLWIKMVRLNQHPNFVWTMVH